MNQENVSNTVDNIVEEGRKIVKKANKRHVIIRNADGTQLVDLSMTVLAIAVVAVFIFQPIGSIVAIAAIAYGLYSKVKIEVVHELDTIDDVVEVNISQDDE